MLMNKEKKNLWVNALRSNVYTQGIGVLNSENKYCCLGVLCEIAIENGCSIDKIEVSREFMYDGKRNFLPDSVIKWADMQDPSFNIESALAQMNDAGKSFMEIADYIEKNL